MTDSDSEEEILVMVEFADPVPSCTDSDKIKMVGLDSDSPIVQYEKQVFKGEWRECLGTKMLFAEKDTLEAYDPAFSPQVSRQYECAYTTRKVLRLKSVVLTAKDEKDAGQGEDDDDEESDGEGSDGCEPDGKMTVVKTEVVYEDFAQPGTSSSL